MFFIVFIIFRFIFIIVFFLLAVIEIKIEV